jgi:N-methylhydantoinase A
MLVGVDIGGTFTDLVLSTDNGLVIHKLPSTPQNPAEAMLDGLKAITNGKISKLKRVAHGSTIATNTILERKGAKTALITTKGFRDVLHIGRQNRPMLYALHPQLRPPLIPRQLCYEVPERLDFDGNVLTKLDMGALDKVLDDIAALGVESIAVCLLYSYVNPAHEQAIRDRIVERGVTDAWLVALSSDVLPEFREYERASTVALEAYVRPVIGRYIAQLESRLPKKVGLRVMKSDGGVIGAGRVKQQAIQTALSGPAAGIIGGYHVAKLAGFTDVITLDMGGTSTDVAICPGEPIQRPQSEIDGLPLRIRLLDIETIGAGGGSIARVDAGGALRVGPESAGAMPGPACYGRSGSRATVSDANAVLGRLDADHFLGGKMTLHIEAARQVVNVLADKMAIGIEAAAKGVIDIANANIDRALRRVSVARGYDPRNFTLVAFGGAGGLHACEVAERLQIPRVFIPRYPGVLCALGLLVADVVVDFSRSLMRTATADTAEELAPMLEELITRGREALVAEGIPRKDRHYIATVDVRYQGQAYELNIPVSGVVDIRDAFHEAHQQTYGHAMRERAVEVVNLRLRALGVVENADLVTAEETDGGDDEFQGAAYAVPGDAQLGEKEVIGGKWMALFDRERLTPGARFMGAALVFQMDSTIYVPEDWSARVDAYGNLILERV